MTNAEGLRRIGAAEFVRRLHGVVQETDKRFALFLGAGCSVSSGIPAAGSLVAHEWLPRLRDLRSPECRDVLTWAEAEIPGFVREDPAASYGEVIRHLFLHPEDRQREIERLCEGKFPGFGYATLAKLVALPGGCFNTVLTTNFDDLVADALYLFTDARPLTILHESLAS